ncbi:hypothetical protein G7Y89_g12963 [Cudoniella acicularis]|uniref:Uncharacterized protein n=1 Tax=Cudoniella acicularis TaxID=354080 RepID=A0A8H4RAT7_9HELO|nr:hypothetical protein G7Y89_g12963 [Cudoniella acicularis]
MSGFRSDSVYCEAPCNYEVRFYHPCCHANMKWEHQPQCWFTKAFRVRAPEGHNHAHCTSLTALLFEIDPEAAENLAMRNGSMALYPDSHSDTCQVMEAEVRYSYDLCPRCKVTRLPRGPTTVVLRKRRQQWIELAENFKAIWVNSPFTEMVKLPCGHIFHFTCAKNWFGGGRMMF